jgi:crotonobetaine/carnitine-CoA ligase
MMTFQSLAEMLTDADPHDLVEVDQLAPATVLFTSGSTGVSKGCTLSNRYLEQQGEIHAENFGLTDQDVLYAPFPLFHIDAATLTVVAALTVGGTAAIGRRFSASRFWDEVRTFDATVFNFMGATLSILWKQPPSPRDRDHRIRLAWGVPIPDWRDGSVARFGIPLHEVYGLTDAGVSVYDRPGDNAPLGSCGKVIPEYDLTIVDEHDQPVPVGTVGEITIRAHESGLVMNEYWAMPEKTAHAFRGGRFYSGDVGRFDDDGYLYFMGRASDSIRRRGENISAYEVEKIITSHPDVLEAAAVGVPSELTEEDVMVCVVARPGRTVTAPDLISYCRDKAPAFMIPRYIDIVDALPKTPTQKVEKFRLKESGITPTTWDAQTSGR